MSRKGWFGSIKLPRGLSDSELRRREARRSLLAQQERIAKQEMLEAQKELPPPEPEPEQEEPAVASPPQ